MCRHDRDHSTELFNSYGFEIDRYTVMTTLCLCFWVVGIRERITLGLPCPTVYCLVVVNGPVFGLLLRNFCYRRIWNQSIKMTSLVRTTEKTCAIFKRVIPAASISKVKSAVGWCWVSRLISVVVKPTSKHDLQHQLQELGLHPKFFCVWTLTTIYWPHAHVRLCMQFTFNTVHEWTTTSNMHVLYSAILCMSL